MTRTGRRSNQFCAGLLLYHARSLLESILIIIYEYILHTGRNLVTSKIDFMLLPLLFSAPCSPVSPVGN